jgi:hypothetical protein
METATTITNEGTATSKAITELMKATGMFEHLEVLLNTLPDATRVATWEQIMHAHEVYTPLEIHEMTEFYKSPVGKSMAAKSPLLIERLGNILQAAAQAE